MHFCCIFWHLGLSFWICLVMFCHFFVISLSFFCHLFVILLSFYCHFGNGKMEKQNCKKMTTMTDLLLSRGSTKYKEQVEKLLESQPAVKKDRAGELALGNSFLGLPGRGVVSRLGVQGRLKNRVGGPGPGWNGPGGAAQTREAGPTWKLQKRNFTSTRVIFFAFFWHFLCIFFAFFFAFFYICFAFPRLGVIFFAFFCMSPTGSHFFGIFLHFPNRELFFAFFYIS